MVDPLTISIGAIAVAVGELLSRVIRARLKERKTDTSQTGTSQVVPSKGIPSITLSRNARKVKPKILSAKILSNGKITEVDDITKLNRAQVEEIIKLLKTS